MSGHSKWSTIKRQKGLADAKRGKLFTKLIKAISVAARQGVDPNSNVKLRSAIDAARTANMTKDTIERAVERGSGAGEGVALEEVTYEVYAPGGVAMVVEVVTDNRNRTLTEIKQILNKHQARLADTGSVRWQFETKGIVQFAKPSNSDLENLELELIEAGAEDIKDSDGQLVVYTNPAKLESVKKTLLDKKLTPDYFGVELVAQNPVVVDESISEILGKLMEDLDSNDDVNDIYTNEV